MGNSTNTEGLVYQNAKYGYSITLPQGFDSADDNTIEEMMGGKTFVGECGMISISAEPSEEMPAEECLTLMADEINVDEANGEKLISKDVQPGRIVLKVRTEECISAMCCCGAGTTLCTIMVQYDTTHEKEFHAQVDAMLASIEFGQTVAPVELVSLTYENSKYGYSLILPKGFRAQNNDTAMEEENGGKRFCYGHDSIVTSASTVVDPVAYMEMEASCCKVDKKAGERLIAKEITTDRITFKYQDSFGIRAEYYIVAGQNIIHLSFCYESQENFDEQVDKVIASLNVK